MAQTGDDDEEKNGYQVNIYLDPSCFEALERMVIRSGLNKRSPFVRQLIRREVNTNPDYADLRPLLTS